MFNLQKKLMLQLINYLPPAPSLESAWKNLPSYSFRGAFAPSFIWCRRPMVRWYEGCPPPHECDYPGYFWSVQNKHSI